MKKFEKPFIRVVKIELVDIVTGSGDQKEEIPVEFSIQTGTNEGSKWFKQNN